MKKAAVPAIKKVSPVSKPNPQIKAVKLGEARKYKSKYPVKK